MSPRIVNFYPSMSDMMVRRPKPRTQSAGVPSEPSPSARRGHVGPAAACTDGPATQSTPNYQPNPAGRVHDLAKGQAEAV